MGTKIEWCDETWNPIAGCSMVSPACTNCYAMAMAARLAAMAPQPDGVGNPHLIHYEGLVTEDPTGRGYSWSKPVWTGKVKQAPDSILTKPLRWKRPRKIFVNSMSDLFHEKVPDEWIDRIFAVMALSPQHTFQVLTKRSKRMRDWATRAFAPHLIGIKAVEVADQAAIARIFKARAQAIAAGVTSEATPVRWPLPNVWLGVTAEDQTRADERIPDLLASPAAKRFVSVEPMLGPIDLQKYIERCHADRDGDCCSKSCPQVRDHEPEVSGRHCPIDTWGDYEDDLTPLLDWVIAGGESGPNARPMHPQWARALRDQCAAAGVPFFFKQWGEWAPGSAFGMISDGPITCKGGRVKDWMNRYVLCEDRGDRLRGHSFANHATELVYRVGKRRAGSLLDGVEHKAFPHG